MNMSVEFVLWMRAFSSISFTLIASAALLWIIADLYHRRSFYTTLAAFVILMILLLRIFVIGTGIRCGIEEPKSDFCVVYTTQIIPTTP